jgi:hypothetical protein
MVLILKDIKAHFSSSQTTGNAPTLLPCHYFRLLSCEPETLTVRPSTEHLLIVAVRLLGQTGLSLTHQYDILSSSQTVL